MINCLNFQSNYRRDFMVVEQRKGDTTYFPHTDQLPILASAITREFQAGLSNYIVKTDVRGDDFRKVLLHEACHEFCHFKNAARQDKVNLFWLTNPDKLTDVAIAQKVTRTSKHGRMHRFRFYLGGKYFQEVYMNGKRMVFTQHAVERFSQRVPCIKGESLTQFLITFYKTLPCHMRVGSGSGLVYLSNNSMVAFPFEETADEIIFKTCLSPNEISNLAENRNSRLYLVHYGKEFKKPDLNPNSLLKKYENEFMAIWRNNKSLEPERNHLNLDNATWLQVGRCVEETTRSAGHGAGSKLKFLFESLPGPVVTVHPPPPQNTQITG